MPLQDEYLVSVDAFCGPLDLLLYLIRRAEVDVHDIPIAEITDQYLAFLHQLNEVDIDVAGEFLLMAASLIEIKSRTLMPADAAEADAEDGAGGRGGEINVADPRFELIQQLLAYQRYRVAAEALDARRLEFAQRFAARPDRGGRAARETGEPPELDLEDVHLLDLSGAYERIMASIDFSRIGDHRVEVDDTPLALYQEDLLDRLDRAEGHRLTLQETFSGQNRIQRIGLFLATLELVRLRRLLVQQDQLDGPIELHLNEHLDEALVIELDAIGERDEVTGSANE